MTFRNADGIEVRKVQGVEVPAFFYGTAWKEDRTSDLVLKAMYAGFRAFDTANQRKHYIEAGVGEAYGFSELPRHEVFFQSKYTYLRGQDDDEWLPYNKKASYAEQVRQSFNSSLEHLQTDHLDSYVLHGPATGAGLIAADWEVWRAMEELQRQKKTRFLGISNVSLEQLQALCEKARPTFVQNRCYARDGWDREVRDFCRRNDIVYQGFSLLTANRRELTHPAVTGAAVRTGKTVPQVIFAFAKQAGMIPLTGTSDPTHMKQDLEEVTLTDEEVAAIERLSG